MFEKEDEIRKALAVQESELKWLRSKIERIEERLTWIERLLMREGREIDFTTTSSDWRSKDV